MPDKARQRPKRILVTAGPTWVPLDRVRILTSIFSGRLGHLIAKNSSERGTPTVLLLGPGRISPDSQNKNLKIIRYRYFDDLFFLTKKEVESKKYDIVIHSAAVADYAPKPFGGKIKSGRKMLTLKLKPTVKIIDQIKKWDPKVFLVKFKLEVGIPRRQLIDIAHKSLLKSKANLIVANEFSETSAKCHRAYIINPRKEIKTAIGKENIAIRLLDEIETVWKKI